VSNVAGHAVVTFRNGKKVGGVNWEQARPRPAPGARRGEQDPPARGSRRARRLLPDRSARGGCKTRPRGARIPVI
jgi:hypothetical protein